MSLKEKIREKMGLEENEQEVGIEDVLTLFLNVADGGVDRAAYLQEALEGKYPQEVIDKAIKESPSAAGVDTGLLKQIAEEILADVKALDANAEKKADIKEVIGDEDKKITEKLKGVIDASGENRYLSKMLDAAQKYMYLFGFPQFNFKNGVITGEGDKLLLMLCMAVLYGVENAGETLKAAARVLPKMKDTTFSLNDLESEDISNVLKKWRQKSIGSVAVTKAVDSIPLLGGILRKASYADQMGEWFPKLEDVLADTVITDPEHKADPKELAYAEALEQLLS